MAKEQEILKPNLTKSNWWRRGFEGLICAILGWHLIGQLGFISLVPFLRDEKFSSPLIIVVGFLIGLTRGLPLLRIWVGFALFLWLGVVYTPITTYLVTPLKVEQAPEKADAVVVLQAGIQQDNDFGFSTLERTLHAVELIREGYAPRLIVTETPPAFASGSHEQAVTHLMRNLGVKCQLFAVGPVTNTHDEAMLASTLAKQHGWKKILLVTSPTHSRRAYFTFSKTGLQIVSSPCRESMYDFENMNQNGAEGKTRAFAEMLREVIGLRTYRARNWA